MIEYSKIYYRGRIRELYGHWYEEKPLIQTFTDFVASDTKVPVSEIIKEDNNES